MDVKKAPTGEARGSVSEFTAVTTTHSSKSYRWDFFPTGVKGNPSCSRCRTVDSLMLSAAQNCCLFISLMIFLGHLEYLQYLKKPIPQRRIAARTAY